MSVGSISHRLGANRKREGKATESPNVPPTDATAEVMRQQSPALEVLMP